MFKIDHHIHTRRHSPDSVIAPEELIRRARTAGLDAVCITEHDYQWEPGELADLNRQSGGLLVLAGLEVSAREGHFLVYGLPETDAVGPGITLRDLLAVVTRHEAAIVAAHPYRWDQDFDTIVEEHGPAAFHAIELVSNNVTTQTRLKSEALLSRYPVAATGSSDAHSPDIVGCYRTAFSRPIRSISDFVAALRAGEGRPVHREGARLTSGPVAAALARG